MSRLKKLAMALGLTVVLAAACTPQQMAAWLEANDKPVPSDQAELQELADWSTAFWANVAEQNANRNNIGWPWDAIAQCESGGNWAINTGNGYYGGLQFAHGTWHGAGGGQYAYYAHNAEPWQQVAVAENLVAMNGGSYRSWPACSSRLGLP